MKILGEPVMTKLMPDLDAIKLAKVKEYCEKTVLTGKMPKIQAEPSEPKGSGAKVVKPKGAAGSGAKKVVKPRPGAKTSVTKKVAPPSEEEDFGMDDEPQPPPARKPSSAPSARRGGLAGRGRGGSRPSTATSAAARKKSEDVDSGPCYQANNLKNQRFKDEQKLKVLKWHFSAPRAEFVEQLKVHFQKFSSMNNIFNNLNIFQTILVKEFFQHSRLILCLIVILSLYCILTKA